MKRALVFLLATTALAATALGNDGWIQIFNGKDLSGWKSNAATDSKSDRKTGVFTAKDGILVVNGGRAHLFYAGPGAG